MGSKLTELSDVQMVAQTCCWLAAKLEESPCRARDLIPVFRRRERRKEGKSPDVLDAYGQVGSK